MCRRTIKTIKSVIDFLKRGLHPDVCFMLLNFEKLLIIEIYDKKNGEKELGEAV